MKPHLIVRLAEGVRPPARPHWSDIITDKAGAAQALTPGLQEVFDRYGVTVWTAREYQPRARFWSPQELAARLDRAYRLILQENRTIPAGLVEQIELLPEIADAGIGRVSEVGLPARISGAMARRSGIAQRAIRLPEAHRRTRGSEDVIVAILDTGVDESHDEIEGKTERGADFVNILDGASEFIGDVIDADPRPDDEVGHGTHVAGIVGARGRRMPTGVAPNCRIMPVRVLATMERDGERVGAGLVENINAGVKHAVDNGADIINMSLGVRHEGGGLPHQEVVDYAHTNGVVIVAAAGNDGRENLYYPGAFPTVVAVGSAREDGSVSEFSTYGPQVAVIAPGENIYSANPGNDFAFASGTSQAAPFVAGVAALIQSVALRAGDRFGDGEIKDILTATSDRLDHRYRNRRAGYGRLNAADALRLANVRMNKTYA